eukprot:CAMPEP_0184338086 /NCGR_PEP_ID=MMETSP1089-20130417/6608_1 /TAXON_ID=38269 ORGANISM="Gloeochaete wittrockiana, Strain SAG46.84" /NCGR_SAMPLE_ID=MMETSP1089 /ASSEMBLY_ACC=CAM_ASM_000445 /LENGTH=164 /DNA_ID=CAMNT_0026664355 /DNA_START=107 /DNA_END=601 /DNA_ORIENTATION=-
MALPVKDAMFKRSRPRITTLKAAAKMVVNINLWGARQRAIVRLLKDIEENADTPFDKANIAWSLLSPPSEDDQHYEDLWRYGEEVLGMIRPEDEVYLWIAEEALAAPLPGGYTENFDDNGNVYYYREDSDESSWEHPLDEQYRALYLRLKQRENETLAKISAGG